MLQQLFQQIHNGNWLTFFVPITFLALIVIVKLDARRVRVALANETLDRNRRLDQIHKLVNSDMGRQKKIVWKQAERIAAITSDPRDIALAAEARDIYEEHAARQNDADAAEAAAEAKRQHKKG